MNANERLADEAVGHAVDMAAYSNEVVRRMIALLNRSDARLFSELTQALERMTPATVVPPSSPAQGLLGTDQTGSICFSEMLNRPDGVG